MRLTAEERGAAAMRRYARFADLTVLDKRARQAPAPPPQRPVVDTLMTRVQRERDAKVQEAKAAETLARLRTAAEKRLGTRPFLTARPPRHLAHLTRVQQAQVMERMGDDEHSATRSRSRSVATSASAYVSGSQTSRDASAVREDYIHTLSLYHPRLRQPQPPALSKWEEGNMEGSPHRTATISAPASPTASPESWATMFQEGEDGDGQISPRSPSDADDLFPNDLMNDTFARMLLGAKEGAVDAVDKWKAAELRSESFQATLAAQERANKKPPAMGRRSNASSNIDTSSDSDADKSGNGSSPRARRMVGRMPGKSVIGPEWILKSRRTRFASRCTG